LLRAGRIDGNERHKQRKDWDHPSLHVRICRDCGTVPQEPSLKREECPPALV
jgi:hypothetical protein